MKKLHLLFCIMLNVILGIMLMPSSLMASDDPSQFNWRRGPINFFIADQKLSIEIQENEQFLSGRDVEKMLKIVHGHNVGDADTILAKENAIIYFRHNNNGHISTNGGMNKVDKDFILKHLNDKNLSITGKNLIEWIEPPTFHDKEKYIYFSLGEKTPKGNQVYIAKLILLHRTGYFDITWIGEPDSYVSFEKSLKPLLKNNRLKISYWSQYYKYSHGYDPKSIKNISEFINDLLIDKTKIAPPPKKDKPVKKIITIIVISLAVFWFFHRRIRKKILNLLEK